MTFVEDVELLRVCPVCGQEFIKNFYQRVYCCADCRRIHSGLKSPQTPNYSPEVLRWLKRRNLENFVYFYAKGLQQIQHTGKFPRSWGGRARERARRYGLILSLSHGTWRKPRNFILSSLAIELLENSADVDNVDKSMYGIVSPGHAPQGVHAPASAEVRISIRGGEKE